MNSFPFVWSIILVIPKVKLDFPAPVLPTTPIFSPEKNLIDKSFKQLSNPYLYLNDTLESSINGD